MKKSLFFLTVLLCISSFVVAQKDATLYPYYKTWGQRDLCFADKTGKVVIEVQRYWDYPYEDKRNPDRLKYDFFHEGYCLINTKDTDNFKDILLIYNAQGELVKTIQGMQALSNFHDGYAVVARQFEDKCYAMNLKFELEKELPYLKQSYQFNAQGIGLIGETWGNIFRYCNTKGELLSEKTFIHENRSFDNGTAQVKLDGKVVFINKKIEIIATPADNESALYPYDYKAATDGAVALFQYHSESRQMIISRVIDQTGKEININPQLKASLVEYVGDGLFIKQIEKDKHIFVDAQGKQMMRLPFKWCKDSQYKDGLAWVEKWEEVPIPKRIIKQWINTKTGKVLLERKVAPKKTDSDGKDKERHMESEFAFCGELVRVGFQYFTKEGRLAFTLPASSVLVRQLQDYNLYQPEAIKYFEPDPYNIASEQYISFQQFKGIEQVNPTYLCLSRWSMDTIPQEVLKMSNLVKLDLSEMGLVEIPKEISKLINLQELYLMRNQIKVLPESVNSMPNLTTINLYHNPYERNINRRGILYGSPREDRWSEVAVSVEENKEVWEAEKKEREKAYRIPDSLPILSDKGAKLILSVMKANKLDTTRLQREYDEMNELVSENYCEGVGDRRSRTMYPISLKRRKEIYAILKEKQKQEIEKREINLYGMADVAYHYRTGKEAELRGSKLRMKLYTKFKTLEALKGQLSSEQPIKGFNLVKLVEEQLKQNLPEDTIKKNIREFLDKEFGAFLHR